MGCFYPACGTGSDGSDGSADANDSGGSAGPGGFGGSSSSDQKAVLPSACRKSLTALSC